MKKQKPEDVFDEDKVELIEKLIGGSNKFAVMTSNGVNLIGYFHEINGVFYSNNYFMGRSSRSNVTNIKSYVEDPDDGSLLVYDNIPSFRFELSTTCQISYFPEKTDRFIRFRVFQ